MLVWQSSVRSRDQTIMRIENIYHRVCKEKRVLHIKTKFEKNGPNKSCVAVEIMREDLTEVETRLDSRIDVLTLDVIISKIYIEVAKASMGASGTAINFMPLFSQG